MNPTLQLALVFIGGLVAGFLISLTLVDWLVVKAAAKANGRAWELDSKLQGVNVVLRQLDSQNRAQEAEIRKLRAERDQTWKPPPYAPWALACMTIQDQLRSLASSMPSFQVSWDFYRARQILKDAASTIDMLERAHRKSHTPTFTLPSRDPHLTHT